MSGKTYIIPTRELQPGMTVWKEIKPERYAPDAYLEDWFLSDSYNPREFICGRRLQFRVGNSVKVWRNSGTVMVSFGRERK